MKKTLGKVSDLVKVLLVIGVITFLSFLFPNNAKFKYDFEPGQSWRHDDLEAPFDFPIRKATEELELEKAQLLEDFSPYYVLDTDILKEQITTFEAEFNKDFQSIDQNQFGDVRRRPEKYLNYGRGFLKRYYNDGIINLNESHKEKAPDFVINIVRGRNTRQQTLQNILNAEKIKAIIGDSLPFTGLRDPDFLFQPLTKAIKNNLFYSDTVTNLFKNDLISSISMSRGKVPKGEMLIKRDGVITDEIYEKLISFKLEYEEEVTEKKSQLGVFFGYLLLTTLTILIFLFYVRAYFSDVFLRLNKFAFILLWFVAFGWLVFTIEKIDLLSVYLIPFSIIPIVIKTFFSDRLALFTHILVVLIASFLCSEGYEFTFLQILAGIVAVLSYSTTRDWNKFFTSMLFIFFTYALGWLGLSLIQSGEYMSIDYSMLKWLALNVFLTLLAFPLIPLLERLFNFTSAISLLELSDMNRPLLKKMGLEAPGTLQHSIQVANLSEAVATEIGADELLVKTAALYHDIGKIPNAQYFIENQSGYNPHQELNDLESARLIIGHIEEGLKLAKKAGLPNVLLKFIASHHGTTRVEYFYRNYKNNNPDLEVDEAAFRYPGPNPITKEETILMLADSLEAACKSLKSPTGQDIDAFIEKIIAFKLEHGQLEQSELTFDELGRAKVVFKKLLRSMNHVRVEYPEEKKKTEK